MPTLIVAGVPNRAFRRKDMISPSVQGWNVEVFASKCDSPVVTACWRDVIDRIEILDRNLDFDGVHVLAFHNAEQDFEKRYVVALRDHHRIRRLPGNLIPLFGTNEFNEALVQFASIEGLWRNELRPKNHVDPAILPEGYFDVRGNFKDLWRRIRDFDGLTAIEPIKSLSANFRATYYRTVYCDERGYLFDCRGPRHGRPSSPIWNWKFGCSLPDAFHFDVTHEKKRPFYFTCRQSARKQYGTHLNLDAFGYEVGSQPDFPPP